MFEPCLELEIFPQGDLYLDIQLSRCSQQELQKSL